MRFVVLALVVALIVFAAIIDGVAGQAQPPVYLSLGDSLAASVQPDARGHDRATSDGYSEAIWRSLKSSKRGLELVKLGRGGETAATMIKSPKPGPSQLEQAEQELRSNRVVLVTIDIGANEVERCQMGSGFDRRCVQRGLASLRASLPRIIQRLRAAGGDKVRIVGINYYNSFLGRWVTGSDGRQVARASVAVERAINAALAQAYKRAGVPLADVESRFATRSFRVVSTRDHGRVPLAVARTCRWTWACSARNDDHTNALGYDVIARTVLGLHLH